MKSPLSLRRCRRSRAGTASVLLALAGSTLSVSACSGDTVPAASHPGPVPSAAGPADAATQAAVDRTIAVTRAVRGYVFRATETIHGGGTDQATTLTGRAVRPSSIAYTLALGGKSQQAVRIGGRSYLRVPPGGWKVIDKPGTAPDPLDSLLALLTHLSGPALYGRQLNARVLPAALVAAHLAPEGASAGGGAPVIFDLDDAGRVTSVHLVLAVRAGSRRLVVDETTRFSSFDQVAPITAPGVAQG